MSNKKFNGKKSCEIAIFFMNKLQVECVDKFSVAGLEGLCRVIQELSCDATCELWRTTYQKTSGLPFTEQVWITEEEVFTTLIALCARQMFAWEYDLRELIDLLFFMRYQSEKHEKECKIWQEVILEQSKGLSVHPDSVLPEGRRFPGSKFEDLLRDFMDGIVFKYQHKLSEPELDDFHVYYSDICFNTSYRKLYEQIYEKMTGDSGLVGLLLTEETAYTLVIELCARHVYKWDFKLKEVLILLFALRYISDNYFEDVSMWKGLYSKLCPNMRRET